MAGDWIKMRTDLYRDPKVCMIADLLYAVDGELSRYVSQNMQRDMTVTRNVMRNVTVGALVSVWGVLRHRGKRIGDDLVVNGCTISVVDDISELPGFGGALQSVGWIVPIDTGLLLPRFFEEFNVDPAEELKKKNAERQRRYREKHAAKGDEPRNVTVTSQSNAREEKRREEVDPMSSSLRSEDIPPLPAGKKKTFNVWLADAKAKGEKAISDYRPVWEYAERVGIPRDWIEIAWIKFRERYGSDPNHKAKRYIDWRRVFLNAVEDNWFGLWWAKDGKFQLSTVGQQADIATREAA